VHHLMPWASIDAIFWHHFSRAFRPQTRILTTKTDSARSV